MMLAGALPLLEWLWDGGFLPLSFSLASPAVGCLLAMERFYQAAPGAFWFSLGLVHAIGWYLLFLTGRHLRTVIREEDRFRFAVPTGGAEEEGEVAIFQDSRERNRLRVGSLASLPSSCGSLFFLATPPGQQLYSDP